jgi:hypothetical protein
MTSPVVGRKDPRTPVVGGVAGQGGAEDVVAARRLVGTPPGEEVTAQERARGLVEQDAGLPPVRDVGGVEPAQPVAADVEHLAVGEGPRAVRSARSPIETMQPIVPWATVACGAAERRSFIEPHSSAST